MTIAEVTGFTGELLYDASKPDGAPRKLMNSGRLTAMGWQPAFDLREGLRDAYEWYVTHLNEAKSQ
jgi:GDP-L-fucose synthase